MQHAAWVAKLYHLDAEAVARRRDGQSHVVAALPLGRRVVKQQRVEQLDTLQIDPDEASVIMATDPGQNGLRGRGMIRG